MKCLSLWQPWATLLVAGIKHVETRGWPTKFRGPLLIHAAKKWNCDLERLCNRNPFATALGAAGAKTPNDVHLGCIVGRVDLIECIPTIDVSLGTAVCCDDESELLTITSTEREFGDYSPGRFAFLCANPVKFEKPIPFRGAQGFFDVPDELIK